VIVVATEDFEVYHDLVTELRDRDVTFSTIEPGEPVPERATVVVTSQAESVDTPPDVDVVSAAPDSSRSAVEAVLTLLRGGDGQTVVGIDPGDRPGIAVLVDGMVTASFQVSADRTVEIVREELDGATDPLVRIGDGARLVGARIIDALDVSVELVDESGTTPYLGAGARGMGDVLAAVNIARIEGERIERREIEPTAGELQRIKDRSRAESERNRAIDDALARKVAVGDLTIQEALREHDEQ
jgi:hypothetical protein